MKTYISVVLATTAVTIFTSCSKKHDTGDTGEILPVNVAQAMVDSVTLSKSYPGTLSSQNQADIVARVNGVLTGQYYTDGQHVKKGQKLFSIEDTQYRDALQQARATLDNARAEYDYNSTHYAALEKALQSNAVSQIQVLQAKSALEQSQATIKNAEAALEAAQTNFSYCTIHAPFDGDISKSACSPGNYINGEGSPVTLATIYDNAALFADFYVDDNSYVESLISDNKPSAMDFDHVPVIFSDSLPHSYTGKLVYQGPNVDVSTGTMMMRLTLESPYDELRSGMYCSIELPYSFVPDAILVKDAAISTTQTTKYLYVVNDSNKVVYTPIEVGELANDSMRIVTNGLKGGEKYVTEALLKVRPGMEVKPILTK